MAYTPADLDLLDAKILSGELRWTLDGRTVEYRSLDDLLRVRALVAAQLANSGFHRPRHQLADFSD